MCMTKEKVSALIGRPLSTVEDTNFDLYLKIATASLEEMLCTSISSETEAREFESQEGYKTVFTDIFSDVTEVKINGDVVSADDYSVRLWDKRTGDWFNSIVFDTKQSDGVVEVTADWGFSDCMPADLQYLFAGLFGLVSAKNTSNGIIQSKQVEDFRISFRTDVTVTDQFMIDNRSIISKYSMCDIPRVTSPRAGHCWGYDRFYWEVGNGNSL